MIPSSLDAAGMELETEPLDPARVLEGTPRTGHRVVEERDGVELGVWEHSVGTSTDVETDEWFVVLTGDATVSFEGPRPSLELRPGILARLEAGERTTWTVRVPLRKLYLAR